MLIFIVGKYLIQLAIKANNQLFNSHLSIKNQLDFSSFSALLLSMHWLSKRRSFFIFAHLTMDEALSSPTLLSTY
jgi:hypothetical protein